VREGRESRSRKEPIVLWRSSLTARIRRVLRIPDESHPRRRNPISARKPQMPRDGGAERF